MEIINIIEINKPVETVIELLENHDNYFKWDTSIQSFETFDGNPAEVGAKTKFIFRMGKNRKNIVEAIETIIYRDFPNEYHATYETMGFSAIQKNFFSETVPNRTQWVLKQEYNLKGVAGLFHWIFRHLLKKQAKIAMKRFKEFAEKAE
jgi:hypothetical protein